MIQIAGDLWRMEWYEIIGFVVLWFVGLYSREKCMSTRKIVTIMIVGERGINRDGAGEAYLWF